MLLAFVTRNSIDARLASYASPHQTSQSSSVRVPDVLSAWSSLSQHSPVTLSCTHVRYPECSVMLDQHKSVMQAQQIKSISVPIAVLAFPAISMHCELLSVECWVLACTLSSGRSEQ